MSLKKQLQRPRIRALLIFIGCAVVIYQLWSASVPSLISIAAALAAGWYLERRDLRRMRSHTNAAMRGFVVLAVQMLVLWVGVWFVAGMANVGLQSGVSDVLPLRFNGDETSVENFCYQGIIAGLGADILILAKFLPLGRRIRRRKRRVIPGQESPGPGA
jgi:hypothetical protein